MKIFKIGYQGIEGSWAEEATRIFIKKLGLKNTRAIPLINSRTVAKKLIDGDIDYGVMAVKNSIGGTVAETSAAMRKIFYVFLK